MKTKLILLLAAAASARGQNSYSARNPVSDLPGMAEAGYGHNGGESGALYLTAEIAGNDNIGSHGWIGSLQPAPPYTLHRLAQEGVVQ